MVRISLPMRRELPVKPRILIVEDEVMIRIFMRDVFEEAAGFKTREAANAEAKRSSCSKRKNSQPFSVTSRCPAR